MLDESLVSSARIANSGTLRISSRTDYSMFPDIISDDLIHDVTWQVTHVVKPVTHVVKPVMLIKIDIEKLLKIIALKCFMRIINYHSFFIRVAKEWQGSGIRCDALFKRRKPMARNFRSHLQHLSDKHMCGSFAETKLFFNYPNQSLFVPGSSWVTESILISYVSVTSEMLKPSTTKSAMWNTRLSKKFVKSTTVSIGSSSSSNLVKLKTNLFSFWLYFLRTRQDIILWMTS